MAGRHALPPAAVMSLGCGALAGKRYTAVYYTSTRMGERFGELAGWNAHRAVLVWQKMVRLRSAHFSHWFRTCFQTIAEPTFLCEFVMLHFFASKRQQTLGHPANQAVAVGHLAGSPEGEASVVLGIGDNPGLPIIARLYQQMHWLPGFVAYPLHLMSIAFPKFFSKKQPRAIVAFSARTGELRWWYELEAFHYPAAAGESERLLDRLAAMGNGTNPKNDPLCLPDSCAQPVLDSGGTVFVPFQDGKIYAIRDDDADGIINPATEVSTFDVGDGFQASLALAPGMLAAAPCGGGLHVFRS
ncbi:unnamed protein product [Polarella glacialis]|uniref:Uncharacterized protein n=1 Tax=Polarella glacialis TaxID=89957 RepID=A0A813J748_POLGL|nr:unnamed protein product [Polarella glacialis]